MRLSGRRGLAHDVTCSAKQVMFFYRNKHIMIDLGTGNNNKITWPFHDKQVIRNIVSVWI